MSTIQFRRIANDAIATRNAASLALENERRALDTATVAHADAIECQRILQHIASTVQATAHAQIARIVNRCLRAIYGEDAYEFRIKFETKRGKTDAVLVFVRDGNEIDDPLTASGGGVVAVAAFALRLAALVLQRPMPRKLVILDEPFAGLDRIARGRMRSLIETLADEMGFQFLLVTHLRELQMGTVIELGE